MVNRSQYQSLNEKPLPPPVPRRTPPAKSCEPINPTTKWLRTVLGVDHIPKSALLNQIPCFQKGCSRKAMGNGSSYCTKHACQCMVTADRQCPGPKMLGFNQFCEQHTRCIILGCKNLRQQSQGKKLFDYCTYHTCTSTSCSESRLEGFPLCLNHMNFCASPTCNNPATHDNFCEHHHCVTTGCTGERTMGQWCSVHVLCELPTCGKYRDLSRNPGTFCTMHAPTYCAEERCGRSVEGSMGFCSVHACSFDGCGRKRVVINGVPAPCCAGHSCTYYGCRRAVSEPGSTFCNTHVCLDLDCVMPAYFPHSKYCESHMCMVTGCRSRQGNWNPGCPAHDKLFPPPLNPNKAPVKRLSTTQTLLKKETHLPILPKTTYSAKKPERAHKGPPPVVMKSPAPSEIDCSSFMARVAHNGTTSGISGISEFAGFNGSPALRSPEMNCSMTPPPGGNMF